MFKNKDAKNEYYTLEEAELICENCGLPWVKHFTNFCTKAESDLDRAGLGDSHEALTFGPLTPSAKTNPDPRVRWPAHAQFADFRVPDGNSDANGEGKQTNPKDLVGSRKAPLSTLPFRVLWRIGLAMLEGMVKYGRHNYRYAGVRGSVYFDGAMRHLGAWWEGEDIDPDSGFHHIDKLLADLMVMRDSMLQGNFVDDRPPRALEDFPTLHREAARIIDLHKEKNPRHFTIADSREAA